MMVVMVIFWSGIACFLFTHPLPFLGGRNIRNAAIRQLAHAF